MKVTGYMIREALRRWTTKQQIAAKVFPESVFAFEGESEHPTKLDHDFWLASTYVAALQALQQKYNMAVTITVKGLREEVKLSLSEAIKLLAFASQRSKMWRVAAESNGRDRHMFRELTRDKDKEVAKRQVSVKECMDKTEEVDRFYASLRGSIASANATEVELDVDTGVFS